MKDTNNTISSPFTQDQLAGILAILTAAQQNDPLRKLELEEKLERNKQKEALEAEQKEAKRQSSLAMEQKRQAELARQNYCHHMKPNRETNVVGQRDHNNVANFLCQECQKPFTGYYSIENPDGVPAHLRPPEERVGGPQF